MAEFEAGLIRGDGIGPEVAEAAIACVEAAGVDVAWQEIDAGEACLAEGRPPLPEESIEKIRRLGLALKAPVTTPVGTGFRSVNVALRQALDLYACVRPCRSMDGVRSAFDDIDLVIIRENTEGLYAGIEFEAGSDGLGRISELCAEVHGKRLADGTALALRPISADASRRIVRFAFDYATLHGRRKVTAVHKANIMKVADGLFLDVAREVAADHPEIEFEDRIVDNMCMQLAQKPHLYDVLVMPNLYGDIVSDLCAGLVGGLGIAPGANIGDKVAVFEATHGSAPKYAGKDVVDPIALILSAALMMRRLDRDEAGQRIEAAVRSVVAEGRYVTYDLAGVRPGEEPSVGTNRMTGEITRRIRNG